MNEANFEDYTERFAQIDEWNVYFEDHVGHICNQIVVSYDDGGSQGMPTYSLTNESCGEFIRESLKLFKEKKMENIKGHSAVVLFKNDNMDKPVAIRPFRERNSDAIFFENFFGKYAKN